jgi:hypothetical protein
MTNGTLVVVPPAELLEVLPAAVAAEPPKPGWWRSKRRDMARNKLKRTLARIIQISQDHEANGVKAGDLVYQQLHEKAKTLCAEYCEIWDVPPGALEVELPSLRQLRLAAVPEVMSAGAKAPVAIFGLMAVVALPLILGAWTALFGVGHHWITSLFGG